MEILGVRHKQVNNISSTLEQDLRLFCKTTGSQLFETKLFGPLTYLAKSICAKYNVTKAEYEHGIVEDLVSECSVKLPEYYKEDKGMAKSAAFILMSQYLINKRIRAGKQKRDYKKTMFIEDLEGNDAHTSHVLEIVIDDVEMMKKTLIEKKELFQRIQNKLHKKVALRVIESIEYPERFKSNKNSFVVNIAKKCKTNIQMVYAVIKIMKRMMAEV